MAAARIIRANRAQLRWEMVDLEALLAPDHRARIVWSFVEALDLTALYEAIGSREGEPGRPAADPAVLMALWLFATIEGVGSAREPARLVERDVAYRWLAGGVPVNYHGLADFRVQHGEVLDRLLSESVTALIAERLVSLDEIVLDGTKVRASAARDSYAGSNKLRRIEAAVEQRIAALRQEAEHDPEGSPRRKRAARERAARATQERAAKARAALARLQAEKERRKQTHPEREAKNKKAEAEVSMTDPEARLMRFADGAVRAGYNMQIAVHPESTIVITVAATDRRNDSALALPMTDDIARRYGRTPRRLLVDTNYATRNDVVALAAHEKGAVEVYAPLPTESDEADIKPNSRANRARLRAREPAAVKNWRARMARAEGQAIFRQRKRIELVNAQQKNRGLGFLNVRGLIKAQAIALWHALAHNLIAAHRLRAASA